MVDEIKDMADSVRQRLLNISREKGEDFQALAVRYALERLLYRLSISKYQEQFVLKGAMLFAVWTDRPIRPTRDLDLLGYGDDDEETIRQAFVDICSIEQNDGLVFETDEMRVDTIRDEQEYEGKRLRFVARLGHAKLPIQVDIGFGDAVTPEVETIEYPVILDFAKPLLRAYPVESVVSEKLQAMVALGMTSSRMKDYYDLWTISNTFMLDGNPLTDAVRATFTQRETQIPDSVPIGLSEEFATDDGHQRQWKAFLSKMGLPADVELASVVNRLRVLLLPLLSAVTQEMSFTSSWYPEGVWKGERDDR